MVGGTVGVVGGVVGEVWGAVRAGGLNFNKVKMHNRYVILCLLRLSYFFLYVRKLCMLLCQFNVTERIQDAELPYIPRDPQGDHGAGILEETPKDRAPKPKQNWFHHIACKFEFNESTRAQTTTQAIVYH